MNTKGIIVVLMSLLLVSSPALATETIIFKGALGEDVTIFSPQYTGIIRAGAYVLEWDGEEIEVFCIDLSDYVGTVAPYELVELENAPDGDPMGEEKAQAIAKALSISESPVDMQLIIWEIITEPFGEWDINSGQFYVQGEFPGCQVVLDQIPGWPKTPYLVAALTSEDHQDYMVSCPIVPVPGSSLLGAIGVIGVGWIRRKKLL